MSTDDISTRQRGYQKNFYDRRRDAGEKKLHIWLTPDGQAALDELVAITGEKKQEVITRAIMEMRERMATA